MKNYNWLILFCSVLYSTTVNAQNNMIGFESFLSGVEKTFNECISTQGDSFFSERANCLKVKISSMEDLKTMLVKQEQKPYSIHNVRAAKTYLIPDLERAICQEKITVANYEFLMENSNERLSDLNCKIEQLNDYINFSLKIASKSHMLDLSSETQTLIDSSLLFCEKSSMVFAKNAQDNVRKGLEVDCQLKRVRSIFHQLIFGVNFS